MVTMGARGNSGKSMTIKTEVYKQGPARFDMWGNNYQLISGLTGCGYIELVGILTRSGWPSLDHGWGYRHD